MLKLQAVKLLIKVSLFVRRYSFCNNRIKGIERGVCYLSKKIILLIQETTKENEEKIKEEAPDFEVVRFENGKLPNHISPEDIEIVYGWDSSLNELIKRDDNSVKWIQVSSAGVDSLDFPLLEEKDIRVTNVSGIHSVAIAESVFAMIMYKTRGLLFSVNHQRKKEWGSLKQLFELRDQTILIAGVGSIGKEVARLAKAFGMNTIGINRSGKPVEYVDALYTHSQYGEHIDEADMIVNILPLTKETKHLYDKAFFKKMKKDALFINVGRGPSVKTEDLIEALDNGEVGYAGLDVFEEEPLPKDSPLWEMENVLITPHISGELEDYSASCFSVFKQNLASYVKDKELVLNNVDLKKGY